MRAGALRGLLERGDQAVGVRRARGRVGDEAQVRAAARAAATAVALDEPHAATPPASASASAAPAAIFAGRLPRAFGKGVIVGLLPFPIELVDKATRQGSRVGARAAPRSRRSGIGLVREGQTPGCVYAALRLGGRQVAVEHALEARAVVGRHRLVEGAARMAPLEHLSVPVWLSK